MPSKIELLDHGYVRLVDHMGNDLSVVRSARVSYNAAWRAGEDKGSDTRLIHYLYKNGHNTPFESVVFTFEVRAPIFVLRQWMRHRTWSYNEVSARYTMLPDEFYVPAPEVIGRQSEHNKQMRDLVPLTPSKTMGIRAVIRDQAKDAYAAYESLIESGVPRELARIVLPVSVYSTMFGTVNLHNLLKFIAERTHEHAQYEIRVYANALLELIKPIVPVTVEAFNKYGRWNNDRTTT